MNSGRIVEKMTGNGLRVAMETLGCRGNYADTVALQAALLEQGAVPCRFETQADVYVINTCTVTDAADKEALRLIRQARARAPQARVVVTGCLAQSKRSVLESLAEVDCVVSSSERAKLLNAIVGEVCSEPKNQAPLVHFGTPLQGPISCCVSGPNTLMGELQTRARYHLRIQDGCRNFCTFCIIPHIKGQLVSRAIADILADIKHLADSGYQEVVLTGTHLGAYGAGYGYTFLDLLRVLAEESVIRRIRISSLDPNDLTPEIVELLAKNSMFCRHLHVCVQSFSDRLLRRMNRKYSLADVRQILCYVSEKLPNCCVGSDVIAGFPGESRQEVGKATEEFLGLPISYLHVFPYSERAGTPAASLDGAVPAAERRRRAAVWRKLGEARRSQYLRRLVGEELEVVVERISGSCAYGTSREYAPVRIPLTGEQEIPAHKHLTIGASVLVRAAAYDESEKKLICL